MRHAKDEGLREFITILATLIAVIVEAALFAVGLVTVLVECPPLGIALVALFTIMVCIAKIGKG